MTKNRKSLSMIVSLVIIAAMVGMLKCYMLLMGHMKISDDFRIFITPTETAEDVVSDIRKHVQDGGVTGLEWWLKLMKYDGNVKPGSYVIKKGSRPRAVQMMLSSGSQTPLNVVIGSPRTIYAMAESISSQLMLDSMSLVGFMSDTTSLKQFGLTPATVFELIIPNTYQFYWNVSPDAFFKRMDKERKEFWKKRQDKAESIGLEPSQVMTLASIVQEETAMADEMPKVAGLYMNRLNRGMLLQADPTVIFALGGKRPQRVLYSHLEVDSPYNTYKYPGLPPAPIRFVSTTAIDAVLNYTRHNYIYMCAKEDFSGYHNFATTLSQHNANAARYQRALTLSGR